jgi:dTDP-L-rhamnose 4-epimerase
MGTKSAPTAFLFSEERPVSNVLITGGAGFIGSHLAEELLNHGYNVRILDSLDEQVHPNGQRPDYLSRDVEFVRGNVCDSVTVARALTGIDAVFHLAASVGVGQSMYEIAHYTANNELGTSVLLEAMIERDIPRLLVASSMSIYGEGLARCGRTLVEPDLRPAAQLETAQWELCTKDGEQLEPVATPESKTPCLNSIYALNKYAQERMCLIFGAAYKRHAVALRFFNVYGPNQALSNPYTGVLAIFGSRLLNNRRPMVFEDGRQRRDFVHVRDVARACRIALESDKTAGRAFNIGSGQSRSIIDLATALAQIMDRGDLTPLVTGKYRAGDIRHCFADTSLARDSFGFEPHVDFEDGLFELTEWLLSQVAIDSVERATEELQRRGLVA